MEEMWEFPGAQTQLKQWSWFKHSVSDGLLHCAALRWMAVSAAVDPQRVFGMRSRTRVATFSRQHQHAPVPFLHSNAAHSTAVHHGNKTSTSSPLPRLPFQVTLRNCTLCFACSPQHTVSVWVMNKLFFFFFYKKREQLANQTICTGKFFMLNKNIKFDHFMFP